jgi:hypothetical protein
VWTARFSGRFGASAAQDPRGGLWVAPWQSGLLLRLDQATGAVLQTVDIALAGGLTPGYFMNTALSVSGGVGSVVLTFGAQTTATSGDISTQVLAIEVATAAAGQTVWRFRVAANPATNAATGQFPVVIGSGGARRVVFSGTRSGTYFVGEP